MSKSNRGTNLGDKEATKLALNFSIYQSQTLPRFSVFETVSKSPVRCELVYLTESATPLSGKGREDVDMSERTCHRSAAEVRSNQYATSMCELA